jgi:glycosyltransferase involved in cell wall biosynthesis
MASIPEEKITVLRLGYDTSVFTPAQKPLVYAETPYLLHVGQAYPHKNLRRLIRAFAQLAPAHRNIRLVLAGKSHYKETPILKALVYELGLVNQVEFLSYVSPKDLPELYRQALALVYPSLWEGFGLPVLEAMACGTPVICSHGSGAEEVAKHAALLVDPTNTEELRAAMQQVILDEATRTELSKEGVARSATFSWDITRKQIVDFFHRLS